jgi:hypothetical protein
MSAIANGGILYGAEPKVETIVNGGDNSVELTVEEYNALSEQEKTNGTTYYISDGVASDIEKISADIIDYDNTTSGLSAANIQGAIDELDDKVDSKVTNSFNPRMALATNADGKVSHTSITLDELNFLSGVTSGIQNQLNRKLPLAGGTLTGELVTQNVVPEVANSRSIGTTEKPYAGCVFSNGMYVAKDGKTYANIVLSIEGTTDTAGSAEAVLGNSQPEGYAGNANGSIRLYNKHGKYGRILPHVDMTENDNYALATKGGILPTVSLSGTTLTINL